MFDRFEIENLKILDYLKNKIVALVLFFFQWLKIKSQILYIIYTAEEKVIYVFLIKYL